MTLFDVPPTVTRTAVLSDDKLYRYALTRTWDPDLPVLAWCGLNPSTADHMVDDNTIGKERTFSTLWGYGGLVKVNMFGLRATKPITLVGHRDPIGPDNDAALWTLTEGLPIVAAWGASVPDYWQPRARAIGYRMRQERDVYHLGLTKDGFPRHPLYIKGDTPLTRWVS